MASILIFALVAIVPRPLPTQEIDADDESEVANQMHEYLSQITTIKSSVIMGDLNGMREPATWLAEHETVSGQPATYEPYMEIIRNYARDIVGAPDLESAARSVSRMAGACGSCHIDNEVELAFGFDTKPPEWADTISLMQRHQWAADRLWEGLIGPSDVAWSRGTDMLVDVPLRPAYVSDETTYGVGSDLIDNVAHRIHMLGGQGTVTITPDARSDLYSELLGLCADCHTKFDLGPGQ